MKKIYSLILLICFVQYSLSSGEVNIQITGEIESNGCQGEEYSFSIPISTTGLEDGQSLDLPLPLASPEGLTANCKVSSPQDNSLQSSTESLECSVNPGNVLLYKKKISLHPTYQWPEGLHVEDWDKYIEPNPVVSESATCPVPAYEFTDINTLTDQCYKENPDYHLLQAYGRLSKNNPNLNSEDLELRFKMYLYLNSAAVEASCLITEVEDEPNSSDDNGLVQCLFTGDGNVQFLPQLAVAGNDYLYIENTEVFTLPNKCKNPSPGPGPSPSDVPTKSSWLSLSELLIFGIILL